MLLKELIESDNLIKKEKIKKDNFVKIINGKYKDEVGVVKAVKKMNGIPYEVEVELCSGEGSDEHTQCMNFSYVWVKRDDVEKIDWYTYHYET